MTKSCYICEAIVIVLQYERFQFHGAKTNKMNETNENEIMRRLLICELKQTKWNNFHINKR